MKVRGVRVNCCPQQLESAGVHNKYLGLGVSQAVLASALSVAGAAFSPAYAATYTASDQASLIDAINQANADGDPSSTITLTDSFSATSAALPQVTKPLTIDAGSYTLSTTGDRTYSVATGATLTLKGDIDGTGVLGKDGSGTLVINGTGNAYAKNFDVTGGQVRIEAGGQLTVGNGTDGGASHHRRRCQCRGYRCRLKLGHQIGKQQGRFSRRQLACDRSRRRFRDHQRR